MAEELTIQQRTAVYNRGGSILVSAAAGSGKTKVLVDRILSYLTDPVDPANLDEFLIITYTKAAASELRGKIADKLTERIAQNPANKHLQKQMQRLYLTKISTVHSFCSDILREYAYKLDIPADFRMAEETECLQLQLRVIEQILDNAYDNIENDPDLRAFVDTQGLGRNDRLLPAIIIKVYNSAKCHLNPQKWLQWCLDSTDNQHHTDVGQTDWGKHLIDDLHLYLDLHVQALTNCLQMLSGAEGMEKVHALLSEDLMKLKALQACVTWDQLHTHGKITWTDFPRKYSDKELAAKVKAVRDTYKEDIKRKLLSFTNSSQQVFADLEQTGASARGLISMVNKFSQEYDKLKKSLRVMDFSDLEHKTLELLLGKSRSAATVAAKEISQRFRQIMVDEYQDSNEVQDAIFSVLTQDKHNCFMVGDVKQSIYQFRLADPKIFLHKYETYKNADEACDGEPRKVLLSNNFRSADQVISAVNDVFETCMSEKVGGLVYGEDERLWEGVPQEKQSEPEVELYGIEADEDTYEEESAFVAERICQLLDGNHTVRDKNGFRPITADDIVILLRSPGSVGADFCHALQERGIRYTMGGSSDLLQTEEVGVLHALLQTISNPLQDIPLCAVLSSRLFCFTADELAFIRQQHGASSFYKSLCACETPKAKAFLEQLADFRQHSRLYSTSQLIEYVFSKTSMDSIYASTEDGVERLANLQTFCQFAASVENTGEKDLEHFLEQLEALSEKGMVVTSDKKPPNCVTVMSIHKSKGLEFPVVFLCALSRKFNHQNAQEQVLCDAKLGIGLAYVDAQKGIRYPSVAKKAIANKIKSDGISEEMRVLYVAMTRAKDRLIMTYASNGLQKTLTDIALRMDISHRLLLTANVSCPGKWILQTAMRRTEAGELHNLGGRPECCSVSEVPWLIRTVNVKFTSDSEEQLSESNQSVDPEIIQNIGKYLDVTYDHTLAVKAPSKLTATQLKGRSKDQEVSQHTGYRTVTNHHFRKPSFVSPAKDAKAIGTAIHAFLEHIDYKKCTSVTDIEQELVRITEEGYLDTELASRISVSKIYQFFSSPVGKQLISAHKTLREFKFSILDNASKYFEGLSDEEVLLQGVVDCAFFDADGIVIIDFKTDRVNESTIDAVAKGYFPQVKAYARSLGKIYQMPVNHAYLYFFETDSFITVI